jgi:transposase-like protein
MAVERMKGCDSVTALAQELGVDRRMLYRWREQLDPEEGTPSTGVPSFEPNRPQEIQQLKQLLAEKTLEVDFFKGALHKVGARRQQKGSSGGTTSTN